MEINLLNRLPGGRELVEWYGGIAPSFHDAEILAVTLDRDGATCSVRVHGFQTTNKVDTNGFFVHTKHVVVTFLFRDVTELHFADFNAQNVVMGIHLESGEDAQFRLVLEPIYGFGGAVQGRTLEIMLEPGIPAGSQYNKLSS